MLKINKHENIKITEVYWNKNAFLLDSVLTNNTESKTECGEELHIPGYDYILRPSSQSEASLHLPGACVRITQKEAKILYFIRSFCFSSFQNISISQ